MTTNATTLLTISGPGGAKDLAAPSDAPVGELLPTFADLAGGVAAAPGTWEVGAPGRAALDDARTLGEQGVVDGALLELRVRGAAEPATPSAASDETAPAPAPDERSPSARARQILPERIGAGARLAAAARAATSSSTVAGSSGAPAVGGADPRSLSKPARSTPLERWRRSWRSTNHLLQLEQAIAAPRLRRSVTIAVVSPKGGVGKTTLTALLGSLLATVRRDRTVAVDTNPDFGSLGRTLTPGHDVFVDDLLSLLEQPGITATGLDAQLGRAADGLLVLPAPTDPERMARLDRTAYGKVIEQLQGLAGLLLLDCGTGLQEPAAQAAMLAADQIVLVTDAEPATASLVAEASELLGRVGAPITLAVNKLPSGGGRLELGALELRVPSARTLVTVPLDQSRASRVAAGEFTWTEPAGPWDRAIRELAAVLADGWSELGLTLR